MVFQTETSALLHLMKDDGKALELIIPIPQAIQTHFDFYEKKYTLMINMKVNVDGDMIKAGDKFAQFFFIVTDDPTTIYVPKIVSLGYKGVRISMINGTIKSLSPFTLETEFEKGMNILFVTPLRRVEKVIEPEFWQYGLGVTDVKLNSVMSSHILFRNGIQDLNMVVSWWNYKHNIGIVKRYEANLDSFYNKVGIHDYAEFNTEKKTLAYYKKIVEANVRPKDE